MDNPVHELLERTEQMAGHANTATVEQISEYMERRRELFDVLETMEHSERLSMLEGFPMQSFQMWESAIESAMVRCKQEAEEQLLRFRQAKQQRSGYDMAPSDTNSFFFDRKK